MATALTSEYTRFTDKCNKVLAGGIVKTFEPNSLTPKISYQDPNKEIPNLTEVRLDETGRAKIYIDGDYRIQVYSRDGVLIEDNLLVEQSLVQRDFTSLSQALELEQQEKLNQFQAQANEVIAQGFYKGFATEALLLAAKPTVSEMRARADNTRKIWRWNRTSGEGVVPVTGTWTDTGLSDVDQAKKVLLNVFDTYANLVAANIPRYNYAIVLSDPDPAKNGHYQRVADDSLAFLRYNTPVQVADFLGKKGFAKVIPSTESNINYDTTTSILTFSSTVIAITNSFTYVVATPVSIPLLTDGVYRLEFNESTKKLQAVKAGEVKTDGWLVVGFIRRNFDGITTNLFTNFLINGAAVSVSANPKTNYSLALTTASNLNFDFINNKIVISASIWIQYDGGRIQISPQEIALDPARNKGYTYTLVVNPKNSTLSVVSTVFPYSIPKDSFQIGAYYEPDLLFYGLTHFSVNGVAYSKGAAVRPSFGWDFNNKVDVNVTDEFLNASPVNLANLTTSVVYGWYDALVAEYPDYITKTLLGNDASGTLPIYQYRFKPILPSKVNPSVDFKMPKVMLISVHNEGINMVATHILMREICQNWQAADSLASMRYGLEFVVIPVGNPWGLNNGQRKNSNAVDINRNFPAGWLQLGTPADVYYSGTAPLTESEAQHIYAAMVAEKPDIYYDVHSYGPWNQEGTSAWISELNDKTSSATLSAMTRVYSQYKKKYSWLVPMDKFMDISDETVLGGGTTSKSAAAIGAIGGTFETAWNLKNSPDGAPVGHSPAINFTTDLLGTCILQCLSVLISSK